MDGAGHELSRGRCRLSGTRSEQLVNDLPHRPNVASVPPIGAIRGRPTPVYPAVRESARWMAQAALTSPT